MVAWGPILAAAAPPILNAIMGGNKTSATQSKEPGSYVNPEAEGVSADVWKILNSPEFRERFQTDADWRKQFHQTNINRGDESLEGYLGVLRRMDEYEKGAQLSGKIGGSSIDILPRSAERISDRMGSKAQDIFGKTKGQEAERLAFGLENTPNKGFLDWFNRMQDAADKENARRSGLPTEFAELDEPFDIAGLIKGLTPLYEGYESGGGDGSSDFSYTGGDWQDRPFTG